MKKQAIIATENFVEVGGGEHVTWCASFVCLLLVRSVPGGSNYLLFPLLRVIVRMTWNNDVKIRWELATTT